MVTRRQTTKLTDTLLSLLLLWLTATAIGSRAFALALSDGTTLISPGMINLGNTCYLNSQLECAFHIPLVRSLIESPPSSKKRVSSPAPQDDNAEETEPAPEIPHRTDTELSQDASIAKVEGDEAALSSAQNTESIMETVLLNNDDEESATNEAVINTEESCKRGEGRATEKAAEDDDDKEASVSAADVSETRGGSEVHDEEPVEEESLGGVEVAGEDTLEEEGRPGGDTTEKEKDNPREVFGIERQEESEGGNIAKAAEAADEATVYETTASSLQESSKAAPAEMPVEAELDQGKPPGGTEKESLVGTYTEFMVGMEQDVQAGGVLPESEKEQGLSQKESAVVTSKVEEEEQEEPVTESLAILALRRVFQDMKASTTPVAPRVLCQTLGIPTFEQQDSQEFWKLLLPALNRPDLVDLYQGSFEDYIKATDGSNRERRAEEPFLDLSLDASQ
jgi:Ubiquitin carboxyl-terminal hydrolase